MLLIFCRTLHFIDLDKKDDVIAMMVACIHRHIQSSGGPLPLTIHLLPLFLLRTSPITLNIFTHGFALRIDYRLLKRADVFCLSLIDL